LDTDEAAEDIARPAKAVVFLVSSDAVNVTGQCRDVCGGTFMRD
jgi:hypothetical protein